MSRLCFYDSKKRDPATYSAAQTRVMTNRLLHRPFWLNQRRQHWRYRLPFRSCSFWMTLASGMTSDGCTARACAQRYLTSRRYWMSVTATPAGKGETAHPDSTEKTDGH